jgi:hypothetical protein
MEGGKMSILKKPYEISVWEDEWDSTNKTFVEKKLGVIGADNMLTQSRAIEPNLVRSVNGNKKLTFKMYRYYIDNITGEKVENPYFTYGWMVNERKIKLKYGKYEDDEGNIKDKWYDFIIKDT